MVYIDVQHREVTLKLVYYGPALSGKTTSLQQLHRLMGTMAGSDLVSLDTRDDRTLFFDLLPLHFRTQGGLAIKLKLMENRNGGAEGWQQFAMKPRAVEYRL